MAPALVNSDSPNAGALGPNPKRPPQRSKNGLPVQSDPDQSWSETTSAVSGAAPQHLHECCVKISYTRALNHGGVFNNGRTNGYGFLIGVPIDFVTQIDVDGPVPYIDAGNVITDDLI